MSLHRYFVPPPLALAVTPAPPPKPKPTEKEKEEEKKKEEAKKDNNYGKDQQNKKEDREPEDEDKAKAKDKDLKEDDKPADEPETPATPGSMVPEPPTPAPGATPDADEEEAEKPAEKILKAIEVPEAKPANEKKTDETKKEGPETTTIKEITPEPDPEPEEESSIPLEPIRLLTPVPSRPIRTKLELNPTKPYPPINTDPRGAYHQYAKAVGLEVIYIDVTKDGWLTEQWKEKSEREALKRLNGEWEKELEKELEIQMKKNEIRVLPNSAQGLLLELWNVLAETNNHEMAVDEFWSKFDWTSESAKVHLSDVRRKVEEPNTENKDKQDAELDNPEAKKQDDDEEDVEWTKSGVEECLATVGVQCIYNTDKPLKHWSLAPCAYLLLSHGFFLLRTDMHINFKPEEIAGKFEVLVTSGHDRVFGEMVKAQREKEYRERKEREKKEKLAKEKEKEKGKEGEGKDNKDKDKAKDETKNIDKDEGEKKKDGDEDKLDTPEPGTPTSNVKVIDGEPVVPAEGDNGKDDKAFIAVPIKEDEKNKEGNIDKKHEEEAVIVPGPKPAPINPEGGEEKKQPMNMDDISKAFQALETSKEKEGKEKDKDKVKLVWTWSERCEMWRWKNYQVGLHNVGPGGWEERDWKVFADNKEVWDFDDDEAIVEVAEKDIHDWSL